MSEKKSNNNEWYSVIYIAKILKMTWQELSHKAQVKNLELLIVFITGL
ncbi:hypothetical protein N483_03750 [Pseudoalteromonas luteoviolacea NCIMB 1944]|nr:hypothetical protein N483_03750 [Pseudoalteromonas luteoviolacea NCIMB 1944]